MTTIERTSADHLELVAVDLYRDIHKGIRAELFATVGQAGSLDPSDRASREALAGRVRDAVALLVSHAEHEDGAVQPVLERELPHLAARIEADHVALDGRMLELVALAEAAADAPAAERAVRCHRTYLELAWFTAAYLEHQDVEERVVMPALEAAVGVEAVLGIHVAIVSSIPPDEMGRSLSLMLPAMNVDGRAELLGGMRAGAPAAVFEGVWGLAGAVLQPADHRALGARLGIA